MSHLTDAEIVDFLDGVLPASRAEHMDDCPRCQAQADDARAMLVAVADLDADVPSPLFWEQFSARVRDAVGAESARAERRWDAILFNPALRWATAASLAVLVMLGALWHATSQPPPTPSTPSPAALAVEPPPVDDVDQDEAWAVVRSAARDLVWEDMASEGLAVRPGHSEQALDELSAAERAELARLLEEELKRNGA
jgi:hypothetical protein